MYFTEDQERQLEEIGVRNLSEYLREKMKEDYAQRTPLTSLREELERRRQEIAVLQTQFEARAVIQERALELVDAAAATVRRLVAHEPGRSVQTTIARWVENNPNGRRLREILPPSVSRDEVVAILESWPESRARVVQLLEVRP